MATAPRPSSDLASRGHLPPGEGILTHHRPLTRTFAEQKCLVTAKDSTFAARHEDRCKRIKIQRSNKTERECLRNRKHSLFFTALLIENSEDFKRAAALLLSCAAAQQAPAISSWRLDTTLLCAAKKNGVEKRTVWRPPPEKTGPWATRRPP